MAHTMLSLVVAIVAIALPDCINPSLIGAEAFFGAGPHPGRQTAAFALAAFVVTFAVGLALALGLGDLILSVLPKPGATVKYALLTAAGVGLVAAGAVLWIRRKVLASPPPDGQIERKEPGSPILLGSSLAALEVLTAFPYFAAIALIVGSSASGSGKLFLLVLYCLVYAAPLFGIAILCAVMGSRAESVLGPVVGWLLPRWPAFVAPVAAIGGLALTTYGIVRLGAS